MSHAFSLWMKPPARSAVATRLKAGAAGLTELSTRAESQTALSPLVRTDARLDSRGNKTTANAVVEVVEF